MEIGLTEKEIKVESVSTNDKKEYYYYEHLRHLSNEQIVKLIQTTNESLY